MATLVSEQMPVADVMNRVDDLESLEDTLDVMVSAALLNDIRESLDELGEADAPVLTKEEAPEIISGQ